MAPRTVFLGNAPWSAVALRAMLEDAPERAPVLAITREPRPAGRGSRLRATPVALLARERDLPLLEVVSVRAGEGLAAIREARPDVLVVVAYGEILTADVLAAPLLGCVNLHFSLLPRWRGASPVQRAILAGDAATGATTMLMDDGLDTGPVLLQEETAIASDDDAGSLGTRLAQIGGRMIIRTVDGLDDGSLRPRPQPPEGVTLAPKLTPDERWLDWSEDARSLDRRVRAMVPEPGASTWFRGLELKVLRGAPVPDAGGQPGAITVSGNDVIVATGDGGYLISDVLPSGRARMEASAWARGARFEPGERLG